MLALLDEIFHPPQAQRGKFSFEQKALIDFGPPSSENTPISKPTFKRVIVNQPLFDVVPAERRKGFISTRKMNASQTGLLNSPKTKMINGIMLVVFPYPFVQVFLWRCNLETTDGIVVPGAWVPNPPNADGCTPVAFWGLGFGKVKALLRKPRHQHLLVGDPLNSVG